MKTGVTAVALAASALLATPANAQTGNRVDRSVSAAELRGGADITRRNFSNRDAFTTRRRGDRNNFRGSGNRGHDNGHQKANYSVYLNEYGQSPDEVKYLVDEAIYACSCQLEIDAHKYGYKEGSFRRAPHVEQIGPKKFVVKGGAKLFDGYDYSRQSYDCLVRRGRITRATDIHPVSYTSHHSRRNGFRRGYGSRLGWNISFGNW